MHECFYSADTICSIFTSTNHFHNHVDKQCRDTNGNYLSLYYIWAITSLLMMFSIYPELRSPLYSSMIILLRFDNNDGDITALVVFRCMWWLVDNCGSGNESHAYVPISTMTEIYKTGSKNMHMQMSVFVRIQFPPIMSIKSQLLQFDYHALSKCDDYKKKS